MKKLITIAVLLCSISTFAQTNFQPSNVLKWNFGSMFVQSYSFTYERNYSKQHSFLVNASYMYNKSDLFGAELKGYIITPEFRTYLDTTKAAMSGYYLSGYARFGKFQAMDYDYSYNRTGNGGNLITNNVTGGSFGFLFGKQLALSNKFYFDMFIGPQIVITQQNSEGVKVGFASEYQAALPVRAGFNVGVKF